MPYTNLQMSAVLILDPDSPHVQWVTTNDGRTVLAVDNEYVKSAELLADQALTEHPIQ